jgi:hypothetical protein
MIVTRKPLLTGVLPGVCVAAAIVMGACDGGGEESRSSAASESTRIPQPTAAHLAAANLDIPVAPRSERVDLVAPPFSTPTKITNPLFPIGNLRSAILSGKVDGKDFKTETTLLPETRIIKWRGGEIEALVSQYVAYLDGRIEEVALDHYAQADDGSVWYLGEDVFNYKDGFIADTEGTWFTGREGPPALIMPGEPKVGDVYRPENIPGLVFEEVTIKTVDKTVAGPHGPVRGAIVGSELHQDGTREDKVFAPGYGEFYTASGGDVEAMALALPADELPGPPPTELRTLSEGANDVFAQARSRSWKAAADAVRTMTAAFKRFQRGEVPARLDARMSSALEALVGAVDARDPVQARLAAIRVAQGSLDLQLRHRPPAEIDRARFELWARQLLVDSEADDLAGIRGDLAVLEWIRDRFVHTLDGVDAIRIDAHLGELRTNVTDEDLRAAGSEAARLRARVSRSAGEGRSR